MATVTKRGVAILATTRNLYRAYEEKYKFICINFALNLKIAYFIFINKYVFWLLQTNFICSFGYIFFTSLPKK